MKANTFAEHLCQFTQAVDHVTEPTFSQVLAFTATYAHQKLGFSYFEFMTPQVVNGRDGLVTFANYLDGRSLGRPYSTEIFEPGKGRKPRTQSALAFARNSPLWLVSKTKEPLSDCDDIEDQWSQQMSLPKYKQTQVLVARTSVIVPVGGGADHFGVIDFEGEACIPHAKTIEKELSAIADCVAQLWFLYQALEAQNRGTEEALDYLNDILASGALPDLGTARLFLAYPGRGKEDVLRIINAALSEFADRIEIMDWSKLDKPGNVTIELLRHIDQCRFGLCYFSEEIPGKINSFQDNSNVLFEAGMLHALTNRPVGPPRFWIPIREAGSPAAPFDFASERMIIIQRDEQGRITADEEEQVVGRLRSMLAILLETI